MAEGSVYSFIDGAYVRERMRAAGRPLIDPDWLITHLVESPATYQFCPSGRALRGRTTFYDAIADSAQLDEETAAYWRAIELQPNLQLGFGWLRGAQKRPRQKAVDTLIAVHMLVGAFSGIFGVAILVSGDADFVPVVEEVKRRGVAVIVAGWDDPAMSDDLRRSADRYISIQNGWVRPMVENGRNFKA